MTAPARAAVLVAMMLALGPAALRPAAGDRVAGYWDTMDSLTGVEGKDPMLVEYGGRLYNFYQLRTELYNPDGSRLGIRGDLLYSSFNGSNWSQPVCLSPVNNDIQAHNCHDPWATAYDGRLYVTAQAIEPSIKDDTMPGDPDPVNNTDYDIITRVYDGTTWDPPLERPFHLVNAPNDGGVADQECRSIVFRGTLYFVWVQIPAGGNNTTTEERRLVYRKFDGTNWGPVTIAAEDPRSLYGDPSLAVFHDRLYVTVQTNTSADRDVDIVSLYFDGARWSAPETVNPVVPGYAVKRYNIISRLAVLGDRLWCAWESQDAIAKSSGHLDILLSSTGGSGWDWPAVVDPSRRTGDDFWPTMAAFNGSVHIAWSSNDPGTTDGQQDNDVVTRSFDGRNWTPVAMVSPYGDNGTIGGEHNAGDDNQPFLYSWNGSLYCTWISFDQFEGGIGHPGAEFTTIVKRVEGPGGSEGGGGQSPVENPEVERPGSTQWLVVAALAIAVIAIFAMIAAGAAVIKRRRPARAGPSRIPDGPRTRGKDE